MAISGKGITNLDAKDSLSGDEITSATVATGDKILIQDVDDGDTLKTVTAQSIADLNSGGVSKVGTPANDQVGVWTGDGTIEGTSGLTYNGTALDITGDITVSGTVDGRDIATDGTKLDGIEASADVTDETNVISALDGATISSATVAAGDKVLIQDVDDSDNLKHVTAQSIADLASGGGGAVVQHVYSTTSSATSTTGSIPADNTIPQNTEGTELLTVTITPTSASNNLVVYFSGCFASNADRTIGAAFFQDSTADAIHADAFRCANGTNNAMRYTTTFVIAAGTTSATTLKMRYGAPVGSTTYAGAMSQYSTAEATVFSVFEVTP